MSPTAMYAWLKGTRAPKPKHLQELAKQLYPLDEAGRTRFLSEVQSAIALDRSDGGSLPDMIPLSIRPGIIDYGNFSHPTDPENYGGFVVELFRRFAAFAGIEVGTVLADDTMAAAQSPLLQGRTDVTLGLLGTADRLQFLEFNYTPIRIGLNAVAPARVDDDPNLRTTLQKSFHLDQKKTRNFLPIVHQKEIGGLFVELTLKMANANQRVLVDVFSVDAYAEVFRREAARGYGLLPLVVADEFTCIKLIKALNGEGTLLFDLVDQQSPFPRYPLGFAVNRKRLVWKEYLRQAFELYLATDTDGIVGLYRQLWDKLLIELRNALAGDAYWRRNLPGQGALELESKVLGWLSRTLGASESSILSPGWQTVIARALPVFEVGSPTVSGASGGQRSEINDHLRAIEEHTAAVLRLASEAARLATSTRDTLQQSQE